MCGRYSLFEPDKMYDRFSIVNRQLSTGIEPHVLKVNHFYHCCASLLPIPAKIRANSLKFLLADADADQGVRPLRPLHF